MHARTRQRSADLAWQQRRQVAVLFADISGFTRLVETFDPEEVYALVRPLMEELIQLVDAHDGEIQQVLGDGFMCVFGLRGTRGDEAERAVRAGRALVGAGRASLAVHAGIECGEVLVAPSWEPARFGVWGHAVNLAKRLCDLAGPGELDIGPAAFAQVRSCIGAVAPMRARVKGIDHSIVAHRVTTGAFPTDIGRRVIGDLTGDHGRGPATSTASTASGRSRSSAGPT